MQNFLTAKDLARLIQSSPRSIRRWWKRLNVPPTIPCHACNRWTETDAQKLIKRWREYCQKHHTTHHEPKT